MNKPVLSDSLKEFQFYLDIYVYIHGHGFACFTIFFHEMCVVIDIFVLQNICKVFGGLRVVFTSVEVLEYILKTWGCSTVMKEKYRGIVGNRHLF